MSEPLAILYEDNHCLAVVKPAPLLTQGPPGIPTLEAMVKAYLKERYHKPGNVYLGIPHRLDRPVSGVIVFARNTKAAQRLAEQFKQRQVRKLYWALVEGDVADAEDLTQALLAKCFEDGTLAAYDTARASFRTFLRMLFDRFVAKSGNNRHLDCCANAFKQLNTGRLAIIQWDGC